MTVISHWKAALLVFLAGAVSTLAFAPYDFGYLALPALMVFYRYGVQAPFGRPGLLGYGFGLGLFGCGLWWTYVSIHDFGGADPFSSGLLTALLVAVWAIFPALTAALGARLTTGAAVWGRIVRVAALWVAIEYLRGEWLFNGFPWLQVAYTQLYTPLSGYAPLVGVYGVGFLLAFSAFTLAEMLPRRLSARQGLSWLLLIWGGGWCLQGTQWTQPSGDPVKITLIQGNIGQDQKWLENQRFNTLMLYQRLTEQHWDSDVIIWPETAIPAFLSEIKADFLDPLAAEARARGVDLVVSLPTGGDRTYYNSVLSLADGERFYHKSHLLPFGEYLPLQPLSGWVLDQLQIPLGDFTAGAERQPLLTAGGHAFVASICYEDAFGELMIRQVEDAAYLVNVTNDAWFGDTAQPHQHMQMAQMRALETGRYLVRATNTGVTGFVGPDGRMRKQAPLNATATLTDTIIPMRGMTPYAVIGDYGVLALLLTTVGFTMWLEHYCRLRQK